MGQVDSLVAASERSLSYVRNFGWETASVTSDKVWSEFLDDKSLYLDGCPMSPFGRRLSAGIHKVLRRIKKDQLTGLMCVWISIGRLFISGCITDI